MPTLWYLTHPQVVVDPRVPVPQWGLSPVGRRRAQALSGAAFLDDVSSVWSSTETKARETARLVVGRRPFPLLERADLGEIDRSAAGFLPPQEFERVADECFAHPHESARGWERAVVAQARTVAAVEALLAHPAQGPGDVLVVGHGGVGTFWLCHLLGVPVERRHDQPGPGGFVLEVDLATRRLRADGWRPLESLLGRGRSMPPSSVWTSDD